MDIGLIFSIAALVAALGALGVSAWAAARPPQAAPLRELRSRVEDLEADTSDIHAKFLKRARTENMEKARAVHVERAHRKQSAEEEAAAILAAQAQPGAGSQKSPALTSSASEQVTKAQLRARYLVVPQPKAPH